MRKTQAVAAGAAGVYLVSEPLPLEVEKPKVEDCANAIDNDVIGCEDQSLGAVADIIGTPFTLHYQSDRTPGGNAVLIHVSGPIVPPGVDHFDVTVHVAGRDFKTTISPPDPDTQRLFIWDGKDQDGKYPLGAQWATVEVVDVYKVHGVNQPWGVHVWGGTLGTWDTRAMGLGGWSPNVLHFYDPKDQVLYLGDGSRRSGTRLGAVKEKGTELFIASEDGLAIYVFDRDSGRHKRTLHGLSKAVVYSFEYDGDGKLTKITDGDGNATQVSSGGFIGPFGEATGATTGADDYWTQIGQGVGSMGLSYTSMASDPFAKVTVTSPFGSGLLTNLSDPRGNGWTYDYHGRGRALMDADPGDGHVDVTREPLASAPANSDDAYKVKLHTAGGKDFVHQVVNFEDGSRQRIISTPDGDTTIDIKRDLGATASYPGGSADSTYVPGQDATVNAQLPGGFGQLKAGHTVSWDDPTDPMSIRDASDAVTISSGTASAAASGGTVVTTSAGGRTITAQIDGQGRPIDVTLPGLPKIELTYDHGRVTTLKQGVRSVTLDYNGAFVSSVTDSLGRKLTIGHDGAGRATEETLPGQQYSISPDANGNVTTTSSPQANTYNESANYTLVDLPASYAVPAGAVTIDYDADRTPIGGSSPWGALTFDSKGRLTGVGPTTYEYDGSGNITKVTSADGSINLGPGPLPTSITWNGPITGSVDIARNGLSQATSFSVGGRTIDRDIDADGVIKRAGAISITRDQGDFVRGTALTTLQSNGPNISIEDTYQRNAFGEPLQYTAAVNGSPVYTVEYIRDDGGRITNRTESILNPATSQMDTTSAEYIYDSAGRLQQVRHGGAVVARHDYDANGNRIGGTSVCVIAGSTPTPSATVTPTGSSGTPTATATPTLPAGNVAQGASIVANAMVLDNRITEADVVDAFCVLHHFEYGYDGGGSLASKTETNTSASTSYQYDVYGNLRDVTLSDGRHVEYLIDAANRRVGKRVDGTLVQGFLYQDAIRPIAELGPQGQVTGVFVYGSKGNVPDYIERGGNRYRLFSDNLGSVRLVVDATTGNIEQRLDYDEWGNVILDTNPGFQPFGFAGGLYDVDTKLVRFGARDYDATTGRWAARDPVGFEGGDANLYGYAVNDPINAFDPNGLDWVDDASDFAAGFGDSMTFGATGLVRGWLGSDHVVNKCGAWYKAGEYTEIGAEVGLTLGSAVLKEAAAKTSRELVRREAARLTRGIARETGEVLHHVNPLFGHPGRAATLFPTGGLPGFLHSGRWNLNLLSVPEHLAAHRRLRALEGVAGKVFNPYATAGRAISNTGRGYQECD